MTLFYKIGQSFIGCVTFKLCELLKWLPALNVVLQAGDGLVVVVVVVVVVGGGGGIFMFWNAGMMSQGESIEVRWIYFNQENEILRKRRGCQKNKMKKEDKGVGLGVGIRWGGGGWKKG